MKIPLLLLAALALPNLRADTVVTPAENASVDGNSEIRDPFRDQHVRFQQIYFAPNLQSLFHQQVLITELAFRLGVQSSVGTRFSTVAEGLTIRMSTTQAQPMPGNPADPFPLPTAVFDANFGQDVSVVLPAQNLTLAGIKTSATSFDVVIPLPHPFLYDPAAGHLLIDYQLNGTSVLPLLDARGEHENQYNFSYYNDLDSPVGVFVYDGLVTKFTFTPVPEPSPLGLVASIGVAFCLLKRRGL